VIKSPLGQILDDEGRYRADFIIAFKTLIKSIPLLADHFGYVSSTPLNFANVGVMKDDYRKFYTTRQVDKIFDRFLPFFKLTGYGSESNFVGVEEFIFKPLKQERAG